MSAARQHAKLSASGSHRWLNCTASPDMESRWPDSTSEYAEEGTLAHRLADLELRNVLNLIPIRNYRRELGAIEKHPAYNSEMPDEVAKYWQLVLDVIYNAQHSKILAGYDLEAQVNFSDYVPEGFGTVDVAVAITDTLYVFDLKYGKGVRVDAEDNSQLKLYALGALRVYGLMTGITKVIITVIQPRLNHFSQEEIAVQDLLAWGETIKPIAAEAHTGNGKLNAGDWCRFCRAAPTCPALKDRAINSAKYDFEAVGHPEPQDVLTDTELLEVYRDRDLIQHWVKAVEDYVYTKALAGHKWPGYKLVEGRSVRRINTPDLLIERLQTEGHELDTFSYVTMRGLGELDKIKTEGFQSTLADFITKPPGKPALVPESDKRPELNDAKSDFLEPLNQ